VVDGLHGEKLCSPSFAHAAFSVLGPALTPQASSSLEVPIRFLTGQMPMAPHMGWGVVDVRDVARAHILAMVCSSVFRSVRKGRGREWAWLYGTIYVCEISHGFNEVQ
jgi:hypothetical protein